MADNYDATFDNLVFDKDLEHILEEICVHNDDNNLVIIAAEDVQREIVVGTELRHEPANVTTSAPSHTECADGQLHTPTVRANTRTVVTDPPTQRMYGCGQAVKRVHAWDQVSFSDTESEEEEEEEDAELLHEIPRELFSDCDLNRRLDREAC
ncbi:hypothetical protein G5714_004218 [Onychostoma macrolepis]|uniref:Uncharacterized protein n=1 Tax=Onychostoma macrolepis TaxID=369639 RepID=A0A7J6D4F4_9TELE|nr:hypothetical protein G5714_004218 [Onychostoma macrolepis]